MAAKNYDVALARTLKWEGGKVNHPKDPGGRTNRGVTQRVYDKYRKARGLRQRTVYDIALNEVAAIYKTGYANPIRFDDLPGGLDAATFDAGVNSGPRRGARWLQGSIGAKADGVVGNRTVKAANDVSDLPGAVKRLCRKRLGFVRGLRTWATFGKGWSRRIADIEAFSVGLALQWQGLDHKKVKQRQREEAAQAKRDADEANKSANRSGSGVAVGGAGSAGNEVSGNPTGFWQETFLGLSGPTWILIVVTVLCLVALGYFVYRKNIERERERAYALEGVA